MSIRIGSWTWEPVLAMRNTTEHSEKLTAGTVKLVGTNYDKIVGEVSKLLDDKIYYEKNE